MTPTNANAPAGDEGERENQGAVLLQDTSIPGGELLIFPTFEALVKFIRRCERSGSGAVVERLARSGLVVMPDGRIGFRYRLAARG